MNMTEILIVGVVGWSQIRAQDDLDHFERMTQPPAGTTIHGTTEARRWRHDTARGTFTSIQVNVDPDGRDVLGDAANEPSLAQSPIDPSVMVIGWRQFDSVQSSFRQAGVAYSHDYGQTWTSVGPLEPGIFRSDPVLMTDAQGNFYYHSLFRFVEDHHNLFKSTDGGTTWTDAVRAMPGDKQWMAIDRRPALRPGHVYAYSWNQLARSVNGGSSFEPPVTLPDYYFYGTLAVGIDGAVYLLSDYGYLARSRNACDPQAYMSFEALPFVDLGGPRLSAVPVNPDGLASQGWILANPAPGPYWGELYALSARSSLPALSDITFTRSCDDGETWSTPTTIYEDRTAGAIRWFPTMGVAPTGRIDVAWLDTRNHVDDQWSQVFYAYSTDGGSSWSRALAVSPPFDSRLGWPSQHKMGDYIHLVSDAAGASLAYTGTYGGEQNVYFMRLIPDCDGNGVRDDLDIAGGADDCNANGAPDVCEPGFNRDCDSDGTSDLCAIAAGASDCDADAVPDSCQTDCDRDGVLDMCAIASGMSFDCNDNTIPDDCEPELDGDGNGIPDDCELHVPVDYATIADAIDAASPGDTVWLAPGTYTGPGNVDLHLGAQVFTLACTSDFMPCIIDGGGLYRFLTIHPRGSWIVLQGLHITNCRGAINHQGRGHLSIDRCMITHNTVSVAGGALHLGADADFDVRRTVFHANTAGQRGGAVALEANAALFSHCRFVGNSANVGGAIHSSDARPSIDNCLLSGCYGTVFGGACFNFSSDMTMVNCTVTDNIAGNWGGALHSVGDGGTAVRNCILWNNANGMGETNESTQILDQNGATSTVAHSIVEGLQGYAAHGNLAGPPMFVDQAGPDGQPGTADDDLRPAPGSPAIDTGANAPGAGATDLAGNPRFREDPLSPNCPQPQANCGAPPIVDMGAFEYQPRVPAIVGSVPPDSAIDARPPEAGHGWSEITLLFDIDADTVDLGDITLAVSGGPAPTIRSGQSDGPAYTVSFSGPVPAGQCSVLTHTPSGTRVALGRLAGDINADGTVTPTDILALVDGLNGRAALEQWQCDIDVSGACTPLDILALIDGLNGLPRPGPWLGATLPPCP